MGFLSFRFNLQQLATRQAATAPLVAEIKADLNEKIRAVYELDSQVQKTRARHAAQIPAIVAAAVKGGKPAACANLIKALQSDNYAGHDFVNGREGPYPRTMFSSIMNVTWMFNHLESKYRPTPNVFDRITGAGTRAYEKYHDTIRAFHLSRQRDIKTLAQEFQRAKEGLMPAAIAQVNRLVRLHTLLNAAIAGDAPLAGASAALDRVTSPHIRALLALPVAGYPSTLAGLLGRAATVEDKKQSIALIVRKLGDREAITFLGETIATLPQDDPDRALVKDSADHLVAARRRRGSAGRRRQSIEPSPSSRRSDGLSPGGIAIAAVASVIVLGG